MPHAVAGFVTGLAWFLALSAFEGYRNDQIATGITFGTPWGLLMGTLVVSAVAAVLLLRLGLRFGVGVTAALVLSLIVGLSVGVGAAMTGSRDFGPVSFPMSFSRGAWSTAVWAALGMSAVLTGLAPRPTRAPAPANH